MIGHPFTGGRRFAATALVLAAVLSAGGAAAEGSLVPVPAKGRGEACVEPTEVMRRNHMEFILHQRNETVHRGIRTSRHSFVGCIDCHAVKRADEQLARFDDPEHFCTRCHSFAAVRIDCFECHADRPANQAPAAERSPTTLSQLARAAGLPGLPSVRHAELP